MQWRKKGSVWAMEIGPIRNQFDFLATPQVEPSPQVGWRPDNGNRSNQESKFDFLATRQCLVKNDEGHAVRDRRLLLPAPFC
jgi:hypothetical protein